MANLTGYPQSAVGHMLNHYTRHGADPDQQKYKYRNQNINQQRTCLNYQIGVKRDDPEGFVKELVGRSDVPPREGQKATNVISDWVITLPRNESLEGREKEFFQVAYDHLKKRVPEHLIVGAFVHMDETQPHMHFCFVPLVTSPKMTNDKTRPLKDKNGKIRKDRKGTIRYARVPKLDEDGNPVMRTTLAQSKLFDRKAMQAFHGGLEADMTAYFGFSVGIQLKEQDKALKALSDVKQEVLDEARAALVEPAKEKAAAVVAEAEGKAWVAGQLAASKQLQADKAQADLVKTQGVLSAVSQEVSKKRQLSGVLDSENAEKKAENEELEAKNVQILKQIPALESDIKGKKAQVTALDAEIEEKLRRLEEVRRAEEAWGSGSLGAREERARGALSELKPQVRAAEERVSRADGRIGNLKLRVGQLKRKLEQLGTRIEKARTALAKIKPQARKGEQPGQVATRQWGRDSRNGTPSRTRR